jgi:hypothetical protein
MEKVLSFRSSTRNEIARIELAFLNDSTYTIRVKAVSKPGTMQKRTEKRAEGICDNVNTKPEIVTIKLDLPLNLILGPFSGTARDKVLAQKNTIKRVDPATDEEITINYEFNLQRD